jgi:hypothetical protein
LPHLQMCGRFHRPKGCGTSDDRHRAGVRLEGGEDRPIRKRLRNTVSVQHSKSSTPDATIIAFWRTWRWWELESAHWYKGSGAITAISGNLSSARLHADRQFTIVEWCLMAKSSRRGLGPLYLCLAAANAFQLQFLAASIANTLKMGEHSSA